MKTSKGFDQCYNGQAAVNKNMIILGVYSNSHVNDKQEFMPAINAVPEELLVKYPRQLQTQATSVRPTLPIANRKISSQSSQYQEKNTTVF